MQGSGKWGRGRVGEARDMTQADAATETLSTSMPAESEWLLATDLAVTGGAIQWRCGIPPWKANRVSPVRKSSTSAAA